MSGFAAPISRAMMRPCGGSAPLVRRRAETPPTASSQLSPRGSAAGPTALRPQRRSNPDVDDRYRYEGRRRGRARHLPAAAHDAPGQGSRQIAAVLYREVPGSTAAAALVAVSVVDIRITPSLRS